MTIKEATSRMIQDIRWQLNRERKTTDKEIAKILEITPASLSRLSTQVTTPKIMTWQKINILHEKTTNPQRHQKIIESLSL